MQVSHENMHYWLKGLVLHARAEACFATLQQPDSSTRLHACLNEALQLTFQSITAFEVTDNHHIRRQRITNFSFFFAEVALCERFQHKA
jgi:hypothetical protein